MGREGARGWSPSLVSSPSNWHSISFKKIKILWWNVQSLTFCTEIGQPCLFYMLILCYGWNAPILIRFEAPLNLNCLQLTLCSQRFYTGSAPPPSPQLLAPPLHAPPLHVSVFGWDGIILSAFFIAEAAGMKVVTNLYNLIIYIFITFSKSQGRTLNMLSEKHIWKRFSQEKKNPWLHLDMQPRFHCSMTERLQCMVLSLWTIQVFRP